MNATQPLLGPSPDPAACPDPGTQPPTVDVDRLVHHYGRRRALDTLCLSIRAGELFAILGPNGGGKTTLFRILSTLIAPQQGAARVCGHDVAQAPNAVRRCLGVVFQSPSLDRQLTLRENLLHQAVLYGMPRSLRRKRVDALLAQFQLADRANELVEVLSGGLRRRVELAKALLHHPRVLLLDEPTTGLDPGVRRDFWTYLDHLRQSDDVTVVVTTHLLEEADRADRIAILDQGKLVALGTPQELRASVGGDTLSIEYQGDPEEAARILRDQLQLAPTVVGHRVRLEHPEAAGLVPRVLGRLGERVRSVTVGRPSLEDVFIAKTGHQFWGAPVEEPTP